MVAATLAGLKLGGRMREISKRYIWSPQRIAQERPDIDYQLVAIDFLRVQVKLGQSHHGKCSTQISEHSISPFPNI